MGVWSQRPGGKGLDPALCEGLVEVILKLLPNMIAFKAFDFYESQKYPRNQIMSCFAFNMIQVKLEQLQEGMTTRGWYYLV